jgi:radical SAM protein with 4Fe4S-binding SPASM domain
MKRDSAVARPVCNTAFDICAVQSNGDFTICIYDHEGKYTSGNLAEADIMTLWNNSKSQAFRAAQWSGDYSEIERNGALCSSCTTLWNPHYQIISSLTDNLKNTAQWTWKALQDFISTPIRSGRIVRKYDHLRKVRPNFVQFLNRQIVSKERKRYDEVREKGVILIRA